MAPDQNCIAGPFLMQGCLKKSKNWNKKYFFLREGSPPVLEYYEKKKITGRPKGTIELKNPWNIGKKVSSKHKFLIGIFTDEKYHCLAADSEKIQTDWVNALLRAVEVSGYRRTMYNHIWQGNVDVKGLQGCNPGKRELLQGMQRCCLTDKTIVFCQVNSNGSWNGEAPKYVEVVIASIRKCGHKDNMVTLEPGRSSGIGTGTLIMELDDATIAQNMQKTITDLWRRGSDDNRQRSYSLGNSWSGKPTSCRSRSFNNPPPSLAGLPKRPFHPSITETRTRCESLPSTKEEVRNRDPDARLRASSEGQKAMIAIVRGYSDFREFSGSRSIYASLRKRCLNPTQRSSSRTSSSLISSSTSRSSSMELVNDPDGCLDMPNEDIDCSLLPDYEPKLDLHPSSTIEGTHSRSRSFDESASCNSLSTSPYSIQCPSLIGSSPHEENCFPCRLSPNQEFARQNTPNLSRTGTPDSSCSQEYIPMIPRSLDIGEDGEYTLMTPGWIPPRSVLSEDKNGYVPMQPLTRSLPKNIMPSRRKSLSDVKNRSEGNSPVSSHGSSPDKIFHVQRLHSNSSDRICRQISRSYPCHCRASTRQSVKDVVSCHGLPIKSGFFDSQERNADQLKNSDEYQCMSPLYSMIENSYTKEASTLDNEYLPMSPVSVSGRKSVVGNVISIAQSASKTKSSPLNFHNSSPRYPHEYKSSANTTSLDRDSSGRGRRSSMNWKRNWFPWKTTPKGNNNLHLDLDSKPASSSNHEARLERPLSPGGEYVSIDYNRAKQQIGPDYVSLTDTDVDSKTTSENSDESTKIIHDSNRNILPNTTNEDDNQAHKLETGRRSP